MIKKGTHWWSFLDIHPKNEVLLFDSFGFNGLKEFIIQDDEKTIKTLLYDLKKFNKVDDKITLISIKYSMSEFEELKKLSNILITNAIDLFHALNEFGKKHDIKDEVTIHLLDDQIQMIKKETCRMFQIYF